MLNESLFKKIEEVQATGEYGAWAKIYLSDTDILRVFRQEKYSLKNPSYYHETVKEAVTRGDWDTCNGTMRYNITVATDAPNHGAAVRLDENGRAFIEILVGLKPGESFLGEQS